MHRGAIFVKVLFAEKVRYLKLTVELTFSILVKCSQHLRNGRIFNYSRALALPKQYHRSLVHVGGRVFLEGGEAKVRGANDISWVVVSSAEQLIIEAETNRTLQCGYVLMTIFVVLQPCCCIESLVVVSDPLIDRLRRNTSLLRRGKTAVSIESR